jgi:tetratricopeptide (TPR) repeat protein
MFGTLQNRLTAVVVLAACTAAFPLSAQTPSSSGKVPITTSSDDAKRLYLQGRDLLEKLRVTDARRLFEQAVAKDPDFALGYVGLANTSGTTKEFIDAATRAAALAAKVSDGERHLILGLEAGLKGDPKGNLTHLTELVRLYPNDERAHNQLGNLYFGRQEYDTAIAEYLKATAINPAFSTPYNQLGYGYRLLERFDESEAAFKRYTQMIPNDPNPYDSYAELLMKIGRFDESIAAYEKALSIDPNFVNSYVGIGSNQLARGQTDEARASFAKLAGVARNTGERRLARFWTAAAYVHDGATDKAIAELTAGYALAEAEHDAGTMSGDLVQMGDVFREAGRLDEALSRYTEAVTVIEASQVPDAVKAVTRRNHVFEEGRVAVARKDLATAKAKAAEYEELVTPRNAPFEIRQHHELRGLIALAEKQFASALAEFGLANQRDPRVLHLAAVAAEGAGDAARAASFAARAAKFNEISFNFAYVKNEARRAPGTGLSQLR